MKEKKGPQQLELPPGSSDITTNPNCDFSSLSWTELGSESTKFNEASGFWHTMVCWTRERHWNRTIWRIEVENEFATEDGSGQAKYMCLRRIWRKTASPIGGGVDGKEECFDGWEWTVHWIENGVHNAVFGLVFPENAVEEGRSVKGSRYWPFQYPKVRCYRVSWEKTEEGGLLKYAVVDLKKEHKDNGMINGVLVKSKEEIEEEQRIVRMHAEKFAARILKGVRKWSERYDPKEGKSLYKKRVVHDCLVEEGRYRKWYGKLKAKYGYWTQKWTEGSNEVKYVFEEMAIAAYLLALWEREREEMKQELMDGVERRNGMSKRMNGSAQNNSSGNAFGDGYKQSFVDVGCGNGFLVYLLASEGHRGKGIDIESRVLWKEYPQEIQDCIEQRELVDASFDASGFDWIIGNHPDELTPWIPAIAALAQKSSGLSKNESNHSDGKETVLKKGVWAQPRVLILPCCFYDFDGRTYAFGRRTRMLKVQDNGQGKYGMYLDYIEKICETFGFVVERENLRIPSTKYVALLGRKVDQTELLEEEKITTVLDRLIQDTMDNR